jgi:hypothetical protein
MVKAVKQIIAGVSDTQLIEEHGMGYIMHRKKIQHIAKEIINETNTNKARKEYRAARLRTWQIEALEKLHSQNDREILFVVHRNGGAAGKTWLANYIKVMYDALLLENCSTADGAYQFKSTHDFVVFDLTRIENLDSINYDLIQRLKDGKIASTKYKCRRIFRNPTKMVVFLNQEPVDKSKMSQDRWNVMNLDDELTHSNDPSNIELCQKQGHF